jgi:hypothetical protein
MVTPTLEDLAKRIRAHLKRFEADPAISQRGKATRYWCTNAFRAGARLGLTYISYQGASYIKKAEAEKYLAWLDAGNVGRHFEALRGEH